MRRFSTKSMSSLSSAASTNADSTVASPPRRDSAKSSSRGYDTGFPEPFCGTGNTTRRHPDARVASDAYITGADIDIDRVLQRSRRSFMAKRHRYTVNYGKLEHVNPMTDYTVHPVSSSTAGAASIHDDNQMSVSRPVSSARSDGSVASVTLQQRSHNDTPMRDVEPVASSHSQRSGFLRKLRHRE